MIQTFWDKHKDDKTCVIIGNGKSLEVTPLGELSERYVTFGANKIYGIGFCPQYLTCVDQDMLHDVVPWLMENKNWYRPDAVFVPMNIPMQGASQLNVVIEPGFSVDASEKVILGGTVTYVNMQLAFYMGFKNVLLVGIDHRYPKTGEDGRPGSKFIAKGDDPDHFTMTGGVPYFEPGKIYNRPELDAVAKYTYPLARNAFESIGGKVINLTPNTALDVFEKGRFAEWI